MPTGVADRTDAEARETVAAVGRELGRRLTELTATLQADMATRIPELREAPDLAELLSASVESNLDTVALALRGQLDMDRIAAPQGAREYARRLAQRGVAPHALARAYRLGHQRILDWGLASLPELAPEVTGEASRLLVAIAFRYIDEVSEQVLAEYQLERERWLALRNTAQAEVIEQLLAGTLGSPADLDAAEATLEHRLDQHQLGAVIWTGEEVSDLSTLEHVVGALARAAGARGRPLFWPADLTTGWVWFGLGRGRVAVDEVALAAALDGAPTQVHVALGTVGTGPEGFRSSHREALRARQVATLGGAAPRVTSYSDAEVRAASLLAGDLEQARRLVDSTLGRLADDTETAARLRETLLAFLQARGSYLATAERLHLHKNTVKYRIDQATALRGRAADADRLDLELALIACRWLGPAVLPRGH